MVANKIIYFQSVTKGAYNPKTGNYEDDTIIEESRYASITDTGVETVNLIYGELKKGSKTIRIMNHYDKVFSRIRIGDKIYRVDFSRQLKFKEVFVISEVQ